MEVAMAMAFTFSFSVTLTFDLNISNLLPPPSYFCPALCSAKLKVSIIMASNFVKNRTHVTDGQTNERGATFNAAPKEDRIINTPIYL